MVLCAAYINGNRVRANRIHTNRQGDRKPNSCTIRTYDPPPSGRYRSGDQIRILCDKVPVHNAIALHTFQGDTRNAIPNGITPTIMETISFVDGRIGECVRLAATATISWSDQAYQGDTGVAAPE